MSGQPPQLHELQPIEHRPAWARAHLLLVEAEDELRESPPDRELAAVLAAIAQGWALLALTEPPEAEAEP